MVQVIKSRSLYRIGRYIIQTLGFVMLLVFSDLFMKDANRESDVFCSSEMKTVSDFFRPHTCKEVLKCS